jgi:hypothetical protein
MLQTLVAEEWRTLPCQSAQHNPTYQTNILLSHALNSYAEQRVYGSIADPLLNWGRGWLKCCALLAHMLRKHAALLIP